MDKLGLHVIAGYLTDGGINFLCFFSFHVSDDLIAVVCAVMICVYDFETVGGKGDKDFLSRPEEGKK